MEQGCCRGKLLLIHSTALASNDILSIREQFNKDNFTVLQSRRALA
jgi:hypothetical protein